MLRIIMDSGKEYYLDDSFGGLDERFRDRKGDILNTFISINDDVKIIPSHISSIECVEDEKPECVNINDDDDDDIPKDEKGFYG